MPDMPTGSYSSHPDEFSAMFEDFPLDADLRDLYLRLRLDGAIWRNQQPDDNARLLAYAVELAEDAPTFVTTPTFDEPRAAPVTRILHERAPRLLSYGFLGDARVALVAALIVALVSVTLLQISPLALRSKTPGISTNVQFTPTPGVTVTIQVTPSKTAPATSPTQGSSRSGGSGNGGTAPVPPGYPSPTMTNATGGSGGVGSGGGFPPPTQTTVPPSVTPTATATPGGPLIDGSSFVTQSPASLDSTSYSWTQVNFTMLNTGTTTWDSSKGYTFKCVSTCWNQTFLSNTSFLVPPGQSYTFIGNLYPMAGAYYGVYYSTWQMYSPASGNFGQQAVLPVVNHGWSSALQEASPACQGDGAQWVKESAAGSVSCGASSLVMAQGGASGVSLALLSTPAAYDYGYYYMQTHVHFTSTSASTFAGVVISTPTGSNTSRPMFLVSPAGYFCYTTSSCVPGVSALAMPASSDFDITVEVFNSGGGFSASAGGSPYSLDGGMIGGGPTGLIELTASGSSDAAYFTNYTLYQYK